MSWGFVRVRYSVKAHSWRVSGWSKAGGCYPQVVVDRDSKEVKIPSYRRLPIGQWCNPKGLLKSFWVSYKPLCSLRLRLDKYPYTARCFGVGKVVRVFRRTRNLCAGEYRGVFLRPTPRNPGSSKYPAHGLLSAL